MVLHQRQQHTNRAPAQMGARVVHVRVNGQSTEVTLAELDLRESAPDAVLKAAVARHLQVSPEQLAGSVVDRGGQAIVVRPEAVYG